MLARYNAWANESIFKAVAALPEGEAVKPRRSVFKNILHTLNHNYVIDRIFQCHLEGREHGYTARNTPEWPPLDELWPAQRAIDQWYIDAYERMNEAELVRRHRQGLGIDLGLNEELAGESPRPVVMDPTLARALDFLKGVTVLQPYKPL